MTLNKSHLTKNDTGNKLFLVCCQGKDSNELTYTELNHWLLEGKTKGVFGTDFTPL